MKEKTALILSISFKEPEVPFRFDSTGIQVYSLEEALFHVYHNFYETLDDVLSGKLWHWLAQQLELVPQAEKLQSIFSSDSSLTEKYMAFLTITDYFSDEELHQLRKEIHAWENREQWQKLKEKGDLHYQKKELLKAVAAYKKALTYAENPLLYNNLGVCYLDMMQYKDCEAAFVSAHHLDRKNRVILLNLVQLYIVQKRLEEALQVLKMAEMVLTDWKIPCYYGKVALAKGYKQEAISYFQKAIALEDREKSPVLLCNLYLEEKQFQKAAEAIELVKEKFPALYYQKLAQTEEIQGNLPEALQWMEKSLFIDRQDVHLWVYYAYLNRINEDLNKAQGAITKALSLDSGHEEALLEEAHIKKAQRKLKDYQSILRQIVNGWKTHYR